MILSDRQKSLLSELLQQMRADPEADREHQRRLEVSQRTREFFERAGLFEGKALGHEQVAELLRLLSEAHGLPPHLVVAFIGMYQHYKHFKGFTGSEEDFAEYMNQRRPNWEEGSIGYPGADMEEFSADLRAVLTASGDDFLHAVKRAFSHADVGSAVLTGIMVLYDPQRFPLFSGKTMLPFRHGKICELSNAQKNRAIEAGKKMFGVQGPLLGGSTPAYMRNSGVLDEIRETFGLADFLEVDALAQRLVERQKSGGGISEPAGKVGPEDPDGMMERLLAAIDPEQIAVREEAEDQARELLAEKVGQFTAADMKTFFRLVSTDWSKGRKVRNRFAPAFVGSGAASILADLENANPWMRRIWQAEDEEVEAVLDEFWASANLRGAGRSLPSMLLYLRDRGQYNIWLHGLAKGVEQFTGRALPAKKTGAGYLAYNRVVNDLRKQYAIAPQAVDLVFWQIGESPVATGGVEAIDGSGAVLPDPADPDFDLEGLQDRTLLEETFFGEMLALLDDKRQIVLFGPPGTGKTYVAEVFGRHLAGDAGRCATVQFHPSYGYEEFVEGIRPSLDGKGGAVAYRVEPGIFHRFCEKARQAPQQRFVLVIDEINRGNLPRIFGELLYLLEKRDQEVTLPYSKSAFSIPKNLYVIGTMNTADHSIALVDMALRRRFHFKLFEPRPDVLRTWLEQNSSDLAWVADLLEELNAQLLREKIEPDLHIGHSHFMRPKLDRDKVRLIWDHSIMPTLKEYFYTDPTRLTRFELDRVMTGLSTAADEEAEEDED